jgi:hypothetical protein
MWYATATRENKRIRSPDLARESFASVHTVCTGGLNADHTVGAYLRLSAILRPFSVKGASSLEEEYAKPN